MTTNSISAPDAHHLPITNRRAFLAATPALAALTAGPPAVALPSPKPDATAWDAAMARFQDAKLAYERYDRDIYKPAYERERAFIKAHHGDVTMGSRDPRYLRLGEQYGTGWQMPDYISDREEQLCNAMCDAEDALMALPAPHLSALRWKLEKLFTLSHDGDAEYMDAWAGSYVAQTIADYRRLLGEG